MRAQLLLLLAAAVSAKPIVPKLSKPLGKNLATRGLTLKKTKATQVSLFSWKMAKRAAMPLSNGTGQGLAKFTQLDTKCPQDCDKDEDEGCIIEYGEQCNNAECRDFIATFTDADLAEVQAEYMIPAEQLTMMIGQVLCACGGECSPMAKIAMLEAKCPKECDKCDDGDVPPDCDAECRDGQEYGAKCNVQSCRDHINSFTAADKEEVAPQIGMPVGLLSLHLDSMKCNCGGACEGAAKILALDSKCPSDCDKDSEGCEVEHHTLCKVETCTSFLASITEQDLTDFMAANLNPGEAVSELSYKMHLGGMKCRCGDDCSTPGVGFLVLEDKCPKETEIEGNEPCPASPTSTAEWANATRCGTQACVNLLAELGPADSAAFSTFMAQSDPENTMSDTCLEAIVVQLKEKCTWTEVDSTTSGAGGVAPAAWALAAAAPLAALFA